MVVCDLVLVGVQDGLGFGAGLLGFEVLGLDLFGVRLQFCPALWGPGGGVLLLPGEVLGRLLDRLVRWRAAHGSGFIGVSLAGEPVSSTTPNSTWRRALVSCPLRSSCAAATVRRLEAPQEVDIATWEPGGLLDAWVFSRRDGE
ncbi:hypothetical protein EV642_121100 [Kribbella sp. VKM Ac-2500]|nr:hypothetical protein EV642_121100 [Kribbella sp. VKM Ac-2500]